MPAIGVYLNADDCWPDLAERRKIELTNGKGTAFQFALQSGGSAEKASVIMRLDLPDNSVVLAEIALEPLYDVVRTLVNGEKMVRARAAKVSPGPYLGSVTKRK